MNLLGHLFFILSISFACLPVKAQKIDSDLEASLKIEANHNLNRLKSLAEEQKNTKIYETEREKSLGLFLEEQEKWDSKRARDLLEYKKEKRFEKEPEETPAYQTYLKEQTVEKSKVEKTREAQVYTRQQVQMKSKDLIEKLENDELGAQDVRPRYDLRKRGHNKWVKNGSGSGARSGGASSGNDIDHNSSFPPPPPPVDFVPPPPPIMDNYDDIPPPPPPPNYDYGPGTGMPYDGDIPPPPPSGDFDF